MTREKVLNSTTLKKHFAKIYNLPIAVFENPYFYKKLGTLDFQFDCVDKFDVFCENLSEESYFENYEKLIRTIIEDLKDNQGLNAFVHFVADEMENYSKNISFPAENIYKDENNGYVFFVISMKHKDFTVLHHWDPIIFNHCNTWEKNLLGSIQKIGI